jgi:hypothetical protein
MNIRIVRSVSQPSRSRSGDSTSTSVSPNRRVRPSSKCATAAAYAAFRRRRSASSLGTSRKYTPMNDWSNASAGRRSPAMARRLSMMSATSL